MTSADAVASTRRKLGRGLHSLISAPVRVEIPGATPPSSPPISGGGTPALSRSPAIVNDPSSAYSLALEPGDQTVVRNLDLAHVHPNPRQPRQNFDEQALKMLAESIASSGLMQPILVRSIPNGVVVPGAGRARGTFEIIAGERRWRAARIAGLRHIPAIVRDVDDRAAAELSLVENLQREDLNPIERAEAFRRLIDDFGLTHQEIAQKVGLDRSSVTNHVRLHELDDFTKDCVRDGRLTLGHAKALLSITNLLQRTGLARESVRSAWSVRELERRAKAPAAAGAAGLPATKTPPAMMSASAANTADLERRLSEHLGTKVYVRPGRTKGAGRVVIEFYNLDQFEGLLHRIQFDAS